MAKKDDRTYIKVHDGMVDHPKVVELSDRAFRLLITVWSYSSRHLTDGIVPSKVAQSCGPKAARELVTSGMLVKIDEGYECRHYLEHQRSREQVEAIKQVRREAGKLGGRPKAKPKQDETKLVSKHESPANPETETETETEERTPVVPLPSESAEQSKTSGRKRPAKPLPEDWTPTDVHVAKVRELGLDGARELGAFKAHAEANDRRQANWNAAFTQWLLNARPSNVRSLPAKVNPMDEWMYNR